MEVVVLTSVGFDQAFDAIAAHPEVIHLNFQDFEIAWHRYWKFLGRLPFFLLAD